MPWLRYGTGFLQPLEGLERLSLEGCQLAQPQLLVLQEMSSITALNLAWSVLPCCMYSCCSRCSCEGWL